MTLPTVVIAAEHVMFVDMITVLLEGECSLVGTAFNDHELIESIHLRHPKICLCDIAMQKRNGLEVLRQCGQASLSTRFIMLAGSTDILWAIKAFQLGAYGYLLKTQSIADVLTAIKQVASGKTYLSSWIADRVFKNMTVPSLEALRNSDCRPFLTNREAQVLQLLAEGVTMKEIAGQLNVSQRTIEFHKNSICNKTGLKSVSELTRFALRHGFVFESNLDCEKRLPKIYNHELFAPQALESY
jgi:DNA-binding NarL/FixJ family response regulator